MQIPISGTTIRSDVHANRAWLSPIVYASFVRRVCMLGGESSGKSTLAEALARSYGTVHVPEYGRELWESKQGALSYGDMQQIGHTQVAAEEQAMLRAHRFLFCDTSPLTTVFYSQHLFGRVDPKLQALAERSYELVVLCGMDFDFVQDGTRQDAMFRQRQHDWYIKELNRRGIRFVVARGTVAERIQQVRHYLETSA
jgi:NadR type nicotinamide-nucleotide adenylyltransferase